MTRGMPFVARALALPAIVVLAAGCGAESGVARAPGDMPAPGPDTGVEWFTDVAAAVGLDFVHFNGMSGRFYQPEIMGPGVALLDYDNDGDLDVYLVQGDTLGSDCAACGAAARGGAGSAVPQRSVDGCRGGSGAGLHRRHGR